MRIRMRFILCAGVFGFGIWITTPAPGASYYGHEHLGTRCIVTETSFGEMVMAQTSWRMWSDHNSPDGYRWRARLIPHRPGLNFFRPWNQVEVPDVGGEGASSYDAVVTTPPMSSDMDWDLEVKLTWDRSNERDWNVEHVLDFDESTCSPA
jgi:hypothetical protein